MKALAKMMIHSIDRKYSSYNNYHPVTSDHLISWSRCAIMQGVVKVFTLFVVECSFHRRLIIKINSVYNKTCKQCVYYIHNIELHRLTQGNPHLSVDSCQLGRYPLGVFLSVIGVGINFENGVAAVALLGVISIGPEEKIPSSLSRSMADFTTYNISRTWQMKVN